MSLKVCIEPAYKSDATGGIARVVDAQREHLPSYGIEIVDTIDEAQVYVAHAGDAGSWNTRKDIPRVQYCHGLYWSDEMYAWPKWAPPRNAEIGRTLVEADMIITPSEWVADILRRDLWTPVDVIPNGIPQSLIDAPIRSEPTSYIYWNKARIDAVCEIGSLTELAKRHPERTFAITVPSTRPLPNVKAIGVVPYSMSIEFMQRAGIYLATTREVFGVSVLEALAAGVPILGYAWGGQREQLIEPDFVRANPIGYGKTYWRQEGILVPPGNLDLLSQGLESLADPVVWKGASDAAKERSRVYAWPVIMERLASDLHYLWGSWEGHRPANRPEISVVIPCYNLGKYLREAIDSCLAQKNAPPFEIIVVDDASTDNETTALMDELAWGSLYGDKVQLVRHSHNSYLAETLNTGIDEARGNWIINLDPDNHLPPDALFNLWRAAQRHPELDVVYGRMQILREDGQVDTRYPNGIATYPPANFNYDQQLSHENQVHSSAMFKRRMWQRAGGYHQHVFKDGTRLNSDAEFWTRCAALGFRFGRVVDQPTLRYRVRVDSMSHTVPEWDWTEPSPRKPVVTLGAPGGRVRSHEPIQITVIVDDGPNQRSIVESLWPQTFDLWECFVVEKSQRGFLPPYAHEARDEEDARARARGRIVLKLNAYIISRLEPGALQRLFDAGPETGVYDETSLHLEGAVVMCRSCGGGMRVVNPGAPRMGRTVAAPTPPMMRSAPHSPAPPLAVMAQQGVSGKMSLVEFTGSGFRTVRTQRMNPNSRQAFQYVFGSTPDHKRVLVYVEDLPQILRSNIYREVPEDEMTDAEREQLALVNGGSADASDAGDLLITVSGSGGVETSMAEAQA